MGSYLVTGAAGFIGSNLVESLLADGYVVRGLDNFETGSRENVDRFEESEGFTFVEGDLQDERTVQKAVVDCDYVLHQGAVPSVPRSLENPKLTTTANCVGTTNLLEACTASGVETVVVASSSSVYGDSDELPKHEAMPVDPLSPYALSKFFTERLAIQYSQYHDLDTVALRYFNVFGPCQRPDDEYAAVIPKFINAMLAGNPPTIFGDGEQSRDFTFIDNVVEANRLACESECSGEVLNVACGGRITVNELVETLNEIFDTKIDPIYEPPRPGDVRHSEASIEKARKEIGYEPMVDFREGLERTVEYFQRRPEPA